MAEAGRRRRSPESAHPSRHDHRHRRAGGGRQGDDRRTARRPLPPPLSRHRPPLPRDRQGDGRAGPRSRRRRRPRARLARGARPGAARRPESARPRGRRARLAGRGPPPRSATPSSSSSAISPTRPAAPCSTAAISARRSARKPTSRSTSRPAPRSAPGGGPTNSAPRGGRSTMSASLPKSGERDARDSGRAAAPLKTAADAHLLDTTDKDIEAAFRAAVDIVERARAERA